MHSPAAYSPAPYPPAAPYVASSQPAPHSPSWDYATLYQSAPSYGAAFNLDNNWIVDSDATSHVTGTQGTLSSSHSPLGINSHHIVVGNGSRLPVVATGTAHLTSRPFVLNNVLVSPSIIQNLCSVRKFVRDNNCTIEFDPFGFSLKDLSTKRVLMRSNSSGDLYPFFGDNGAITSTALTITSDLWHRRLGHPSTSALSHLPLEFLSNCNKDSTSQTLCDACQLGKHTRLPFSIYHSRANSPFNIIHCDLWTSPIVSCSGYKYYLVILDDFSHFS
jgi:histone deacetylase 1/2